MLKNVLADYLEAIQEREFDYPFMSLLGEMGFFDIHFTHNNVEFGKDFIAKLNTAEGTIQYSFQLKSGKISQSDWRGTIMGQVLEAHVSGLVHPSFDRSLHHQFVLATTGRLTGNAALGVTDLNRTIDEKNLGLPVKVWDCDTLLEELSAKGLNGIHGASSDGLTNAGKFYSLLGNSLNGIISRSDIEKYSRLWIHTDLDPKKKILWAAVESELISNTCMAHADYFVALYSKLVFLRLLMKLNWEEQDQDRLDLFIELFDIAKQNIVDKLFEIFENFEKDWESTESDLQLLIDGQGVMVTYLIFCSTIMEILGVAFLLNGDIKKKKRIISLLCDFIKKEPGCGHPLSDNYAISLVPPILALYSSQEEKVASSLLRRAAIWICDRYDEGEGISPFGSPPKDEIRTLLGYPFNFFDIASSGGSFAATVISDLANFIQNKQLYEDIVNDIKAAGINPVYWQIQDSDGQFEIDGRDVITYPNVSFDYEYSEFGKYDYAVHIRHEISKFRLTELLGPEYVLLLMITLRDRYFPGVWTKLIDLQLQNPGSIS